MNTKQKDKIQDTAEIATHEKQGLEDVDRLEHAKAEDQTISMMRENVVRLKQMRQWHSDRIAMIDRALAEVRELPDQPMEAEETEPQAARPENPALTGGVKGAHIKPKHPAK